MTNYAYCDLPKDTIVATYIYIYIFFSSKNDEADFMPTWQRQYQQR